MSPLLLIPLVIMIVLIVLKVPAIACMMICALTGVVFAMIFQGASLAGALGNFMSGFVGNTGVENVDRLLTRGGMSSMYGTLGIMIWSLALAGMLARCGVVRCLMQKAEKFTNNRVGLVVTHVISGFALSFVAADPYMAMVLPAEAFGEKYDELGLDRSVCSRTCEDSGTLVCPMVPWGTSGVYTAVTLGVATTAYLPYYLMGFLTPLFSIVCAITGFGMIKAAKKAAEQ